MRFVERATSPRFNTRVRVRSRGPLFDVTAFLTTTSWAFAELSAICTAPPPIIAPPHVQAHNFAKAIRTDILTTLFFQRAAKKQALPRLQSRADNP